MKKSYAKSLKSYDEPFEFEAEKILAAMKRYKDFSDTKAFSAIAEKVGRSVQWVAQHHRLLALPKEVQQMLEPTEKAGAKIRLTHGVILGRLDDPKAQTRLAKLVAAGELTSHQLEARVVALRAEAEERARTAARPAGEAAGGASADDPLHQRTAHLDLIDQLDRLRAIAGRLDRYPLERLDAVLGASGPARNEAREKARSALKALASFLERMD